MMRRVYLLRGLSLASLLVAAACSSGSPDGGIDNATAPSTERGNAIPAVDFVVLDMDEMGVPNFLAGEIGKVAIEPGYSAADIERVMFPVLEKAAPLFRMKPEEMSLTRGMTDKEGDQHFRFQQYKNGLPVIGGEVAVHVRDGAVIGVNGSARGDLPASLDAKLENDAILGAAKAAGGEVRGLAVNENYELAYKPLEDRLALVYLVDITGELKDGTPVHDTLQVSAEDGSILGRIPHIFTAKNREMHDLAHGTTLPGTTVRTEGGAALPSSANNDPINTNYDRLGVVYDAYKTLFNRDSYNGAGAKLISSCHYSTNYVNAYWNGTQMVYGDGDGVNATNLALSLDVTAHELTHAVTSSTSNLNYSGESGGLNESWSDALGNVVEWYGAGQPATPSANNFMVGEDIWTPGTAGDALRYMCDPAKDGSSADYWSSSVGSLDVHYSSGVPNLAFCLLVKGGTHPRGKSAINVTGIGMAKAAQIWYKAELIMTASTNMAGAKTATEQAATQLGYTTAEVASVTAAWQAVGVGVSGGGGGGGTCSHDKCSTGTALTSSCNSVVSAVCASDSYCCTTSWDSTCIAEGRTIGKSLKCSEATGSCGHSLCTTGTKLTNSCDSAKANCVSKICAADSYCCNSTWDSTCVAEVASICGNNCN
jgi:vibriolysin